MARTNRRHVLAEGEIQAVHCINRGVAQPEQAVLRINRPTKNSAIVRSGLSRTALLDGPDCLARLGAGHRR